MADVMNKQAEDLQLGRLVRLSPRVQRLVAPNASLGDRAGHEQLT